MGSPVVYIAIIATFVFCVALVVFCVLLFVRTAQFDPATAPHQRDNNVADLDHMYVVANNADEAAAIGEDTYDECDESDECDKCDKCDGHAQGDEEDEEDEEFLDQCLAIGGKNGDVVAQVPQPEKKKKKKK